MPRKTDRRKDRFLEQLRSRSTGAPRKDPSQMTEEEMDREISRLKSEIRQHKEAEVHLAREAAESKRSTFLPRRKRRYWK